MVCRYRAGDALTQLVNYLALLVLSARLGVVEHWGWFTVPVLLLVSMIVAASINSKSRKEDEVRDIRTQRQLALGVPPEEIQ